MRSIFSEVHRPRLQGELVGQVRQLGSCLNLRHHASLDPRSMQNNGPKPPKQPKAQCLCMLLLGAKIPKVIAQISFISCQRPLVQKIFGVQVRTGDQIWSDSLSSGLVQQLLGEAECTMLLIRAHTIGYQITLFLVGSFYKTM